MARISIGSVHGRFQPFHNGHLDYVLQAFDRANFVWVGLTQVFQPSPPQGSIEKRELRTSNPLTFRERAELIEAALEAAEIAQTRFKITPFPIETPERLHEFVPPGSVCFTTLVSEWNDEKVRRLKEQGYDTEILDVSVPDNLRVTSGTEIRRLIRASDPSWARFVPPAVADIIGERLRGQFGTPIA